MTVLRSNFITSVFQDFYEELLRQKERALRESEMGDINLQYLPKDKNSDATGVEVTHGSAAGFESQRERLDLGESVEDQGEIEGEGEGELVLSDALGIRRFETGFEEDLDTVEEDILDVESLKMEKTIELCQAIQRRLRIFLEEQSLKASYQLGDYAQSNFREAQYIMAALADEIFLTLAWPGKKQWNRHLLETQLFQTQIAGELFFNRLDLLINNADPSRNELAIVYFLALCLGFRGKLRDIDDDEKIEFYKKRLYHLIHNRETDLYNPGRKYLSNALYEHNVIMPPSKGLPDIRSWLFTFAGIACAYLFVTYVLWYRLVRDLDEALQFIFDQARYLPL